MAITLTITDTTTTATYNVIEAPITSSPVIAETDVVTIDNNISTYYTGTKNKFTVKLGYMDKASYGALMAFRDRQYTNLKYPKITISGDENINVTNMTAKMVLNEQNIIDNCGVVENVTVTFRESKQI